MKKQISMLLIAILIISSLAGCSKKAKTNTAADTTAATAAPTAAATAGAAATSAPATDSNVKTTTTADNLKKFEGTEITLSNCQGENESAILKTLADKFKEMTGVTVKLVNVPAADYATWITAQFAAGEEPDIEFGIINGNDYFNQKKIIDLTPYYNSITPFTGDKWMDDYMDGALSNCMDFTGQYYIANTIQRAEVKLYYNKDLMKELGLGTEPPKNLSELEDMCKKVKESGKYTPFSVMNSMSWNLGWIQGKFLESLFKDSGIYEKLNIITPDKDWLDNAEILLGLKTGVLDYTDERFVEYWRIMKDFSQYFNQDFNAASWEYEGLFNTGKAVFNINGGWYPSQVRQNNYKVNYGITDIPYIDSKCSKYAVTQPFTEIKGGGEASWFVTQKAADEGRADAAVLFLQFLADKNSGAQMALDGFMHMPVVKDLVYPESMAGLAVENKDGIEAIRCKNYNGVWEFNDEIKAAYWKIYTEYMDPKSTMSAEDFAKKVKETCTPFIDEEIADRPEYKVEDYISKVQK